MKMKVSRMYVCMIGLLLFRSTECVCVRESPKVSSFQYNLNFSVVWLLFTEAQFTWNFEKDMHAMYVWACRQKKTDI